MPANVQVRVKVTITPTVVQRDHSYGRTLRTGQTSQKGKKDTKGKGLMNHSLMNQFRIGLDQWFSCLTDLRAPEKLVKTQVPGPAPPLHFRVSS